MAAAASAVGTSRLIPDLPDEITISCIARVPRTFHPELSLVARSWRSLLRSPLLFAVRSDLGFSEPFLCVNIETPTGPSRWYLLDFGHPRRQDRLFPLPPTPVATLRSACAAAGPLLYVLGGSHPRDGKSSLTVQVFDARINRWVPAPRMNFARRMGAKAANLNGRIYAVGGQFPATELWAEALDPSVGEWVPVPMPPHLRLDFMRGSPVLSGRLFAMAARGGAVYDPTAPEEERWGIVPPGLELGWKGRTAVVGDVLYAISNSGKLRRYHLGADEWKQVEGLEGNLPRFFLCRGTPSNLGGMLCLVCKGRENCRDEEAEMEIHIAGIEVRQMSCGSLRGSIAWSISSALAIPRGSTVAHCLALEF